MGIAVGQPSEHAVSQPAARTRAGRGGVQKIPVGGYLVNAADLILESAIGFDTKPAPGKPILSGRHRRRRGYTHFIHARAGRDKILSYLIQR